VVSLNYFSAISSEKKGYSLDCRYESNCRA
jgi:hypothetical protein